MKYKLDKKENNQVEITIDYSAKEWADLNEKAYLNNKGKYAVQGFRKGNAPKTVIEKNYGENVFVEDALNLAFNLGYKDVLDKEPDFEPVSDPALALNKMDEKGLSFTLTVEVYPEVKLGAYTGIEIEKKVKKATKAEVMHEIDHALERTARMMEKEDGIVENGVTANIDFSGSVDGKKFEGGTAKGYDLEVGSHSFIEGFEEQMVGMKNGETKNLEVKFPENYGSKDLAGKPAVFEVKINSVKQKVLPALDDEFAKDVSEFETLEDYKKDIEKHLNEEHKKNADVQAENELITKIVENCNIEVPASMVAHQQDAIMKDMEMRLMYQGINLEAYASYLNTTVEKLKEERKDDALRMVKTRLVLEAIIKAENLFITEDEVKAKVEEIAKQENKKPEEYFAKNNENRLNYVKNDLLMTKLLAMLHSKNSIK